MADYPTGHLVTSPEFNAHTFDAGDIKSSARRTAATGWLKCDGSAVSRSTYADLFAAIVPSLGTFTVTLASPGVFTLVAHALVIGDRVYLTTTGALPTGLSANTIYYVVSTPTADTFTVSAAEGGAAINTTGSQSGVHTLRFCPCGLGDGSTTFNVPDASGRTLVGAGGASSPAAVRALGQNDGIAIGNRRPQHKHTTGSWSSSVNSVALTGAQNGVVTNATPVIGGSGVSTDVADSPAYLVVNYYVKT